MSNSDSLFNHVRRWFAALQGQCCCDEGSSIFYPRAPMLFQFLAHMSVKVVHVFDRVLPFSDPALIGNYDNQITRLVQSTNSVDYIPGLKTKSSTLYMYVLMTSSELMVPSRSRNIALFIRFYDFRFRLPPLAPPYTGEEYAALLYCNAFLRSFLLCKGSQRGSSLIFIFNL